MRPVILPACDGSARIFTLRETPDRGPARAARGARRGLRVDRRGHAQLPVRAARSQTKPALHSALRLLRQRVLLHTMARDLAGRAPLAEVCGAMSTLAEVALEAALAFLEPSSSARSARRSRTESRQRLIVIAMGKLGGGELNVSSDVDLVFVYPEEGETDGAQARSPTASSSTGSGGASSPRSARSTPTATCSASTCGCARTATAARSRFASRRSSDIS